MQDDLKKAKLRQFINDRGMSEAVYSFLSDAFLKEKSRDINILAASRLSIDFLREGWKELDRYKSDEDDLSTPLTNPGL